MGGLNFNYVFRIPKVICRASQGSQLDLLLSRIQKELALQTLLTEIVCINLGLQNVRELFWGHPFPLDEDNVEPCWRTHVGNSPALSLPCAEHVYPERGNEREYVSLCGREGQGCHSPVFSPWVGIIFIVSGRIDAKMRTRIYNYSSRTLNILLKWHKLHPKTLKY
jgi:hypothetical protein